MYHPVDPADQFLCSYDLDVAGGSCLCNWISSLFISLLSPTAAAEDEFCVALQRISPCKEVQFACLADSGMHLFKLWTCVSGHSCPMAE